MGDLFGKISCYRWNGCSVVDYVVCQKEIFDKIFVFKVNEYMPWISDHCLIEFHIALWESKFKASNINLQRLPTTIEWEDDSKVKFQWLPHHWGESDCGNSCSRNPLATNHPLITCVSPSAHSFLVITHLEYILSWPSSCIYSNTL